MNSKNDTPRDTAVALLLRATAIITRLEQGLTLDELATAGVLKSFEDVCAQHGIDHEWLVEEVEALLTEIALHVKHGQIRIAERANEDEEGYAPVPLGAGCG